MLQYKVRVDRPEPLFAKALQQAIGGIQGAEMILLSKLVSALLVTLASPRRVFSCPYCASEIGEQVSAGIFNGDFWLNAALTLLPIPALLLFVGVIHYGLPRPLSLFRNPPTRFARHDVKPPAAPE